MSTVKALSNLQKHLTASSSASMNLQRMETEVGASRGTDGGGKGTSPVLGQTDREYPEQGGRVTLVSLSQPEQQTSFVVGSSDNPASLPPSSNNGKHNWRIKDYKLEVPPYLQPTDLSPDRYSSAVGHNESRRSQHTERKSLNRVPEELDLQSVDNMPEDDDFRQGSTSTKLVQPQGPQYYGAFGSEYGIGFGEDGDLDDDYELLLDEDLAREGLYRGMSIYIA